MPAPPFERLDFLYTPSTDVPGDLKYFTQVLGGRAVFAIDAMGTRVAAVELTEGPPLVLLTDHVEGERPILLYRVAISTSRSRTSRAAGGSERARSRSRTGPCCSFRTPGGHRIALYELVRPEVAEHFAGRFDF